MVKLRAFHPYEGAGVLEDSGTLTYIDFPYSVENEYECTEDDLTRLLLRMNFEPSELTFKDGKSAVEYLQSKASEGDDPTDGETEESLLETYNSFELDELEHIVQMIVEMYVDKREYKRAIIGLERIEGLPSVQAAKDFQIRILRLLNQCRKDLEVMTDIKNKPKALSMTSNARPPSRGLEKMFGSLNGSALANQRAIWANFQSIGNQ